MRGQESGSVVKKQRKNIRKRFPQVVVNLYIDKRRVVWKITTFDQYLALSPKRYKIWPLRRNSYRLWCIEWCHIQCSWLAPNLNCKVTIFFNRRITWKCSYTFNGCHIWLSNSAISSDLEWTLTQILRTRRYSTLNISETVQHKDIVVLEY